MSDSPPSILSTKPADMAFCPGCSHASVLDYIAQALDRMGLEPEQVCFVSDIGCIGISDRYFASHTFHGLHGRSITYAEGIKRVQPDLTVVVLIGDGGCGIGTAHLIHAARRGVGIKIMVCNNFNFGMTGGQHSVTTPQCALTPTTPQGAVDAPFDICSTVAANGAAYVARFSAYDRDCSAQIEQALRSPGFALVDIWELCTAHYQPKNKLNPPRLKELSESLEMPFGVLRSKENTPHPPAGQNPTTVNPVNNLPDADETKQPPPLLSWTGRAELCAAGSAGQRIRSAAGVIGEIAVAGGLFASQRDDFPITVRRGFSVSNLILNNKPILYCGVDDPLLVIIISPDGAQRLGKLSHLSPKCLVLADQSVQLPSTPASVERIDFKAHEKAVGKPSAALAVLAYAMVRSGWIEADTLIAAAQSTLTGKFRDQNLKAIQTGTTTPPLQNQEQ